MGKNYERSGESDSENWNDADGTLNVLRMYNLQEIQYRNIAQYGYDSLVEELMGISVPTEELRLKAMKRFIQNMIICNKDFSSFVLDKDKPNIKKINIALEKIKQNYEKGIFFKVIKNNVLGQEKKILLPNFEVALNKLSDIREERMRIFKDAGLLMPIKKSYDPSKAVFVH